MMGGSGSGFRPKFTFSIVKHLQQPVTIHPNIRLSIGKYQLPLGSYSVSFPRAEAAAAAAAAAATSHTKTVPVTASTSSSTGAVNSSSGNSSGSGTGVTRDVESNSTTEQDGSSLSSSDGGGSGGGDDEESTGNAEPEPNEAFYAGDSDSIVSIGSVEDWTAFARYGEILTPIEFDSRSTISVSSDDDDVEMTNAADADTTEEIREDLLEGGAETTEETDDEDEFDGPGSPEDSAEECTSDNDDPDEDDGDSYFVEQILLLSYELMKNDEGNFYPVAQFLVKWWNWDETYNSFVIEEDMGSGDIITLLKENMQKKIKDLNCMKEIKSHLRLHGKAPTQQAIGFDLWDLDIQDEDKVSLSIIG